MDDITGFLVPFIVRLVLKVGAGALLTLGISEGSAVEVIGAVVALAVGWIMSKLNWTKAINTPVPKP